MSGNLCIAPDVAAEVISPNKNGVTINLKITQFLRPSVHLIWIIFPKTQLVWIFRKDENASWIMDKSQLSGEDVIPGFTITLDALFSEE